MYDTEKYILDTIKTCVWSGFYHADDVHQVIDNIVEDGADEAMLRSAVAPEFAKKAAAETSWPDETDCDRLETQNVWMTNRLLNPRPCRHSLGPSSKLHVCGSGLYYANRRRVVLAAVSKPHLVTRKVEQNTHETGF